MAYTSGGRASFCDKGAYDGTVTYHRLDYVKYQGAIFVCKATSLGNAPNLTVDTAYWTKFIDSSGSNLYIYGADGQVTPQRDGLQFMNGFIEDDQTNNKTKITVAISDTDWAQIQSILGTET